MEQVIDNDRQLIAVEEDLFEQLQVFELLLVEVLELEVSRNWEKLRFAGSAAVPLEWQCSVINRPPLSSRHHHLSARDRRNKSCCSRM